MSQSSQLLSLQVREGTWEGLDGSQQSVSGPPDGGALPEAVSNGGPGGKPRLLRGSPKTDGGLPTASIPPCHSGSPRGSSPFLTLCWGKFPHLDVSSLLPFSPCQSS